MGPSLKQAVLGSVLTCGAGVLFGLLAWGPATGDETEKKLDSPGFRPASDRAGPFLSGIGVRQIAVFPTVVRSAAGTSHDRASQKEIARLVMQNGLGRSQALDAELDPGKLKGKSQWDVFQAGLEALGQQVAKAKIQSDYALVVEILITPTPSKGAAVGGIHCYVLDREGANAFSFLLNSHHQMFVDAALKTRDASAKGQGELVAGAVRTALKALGQQVKGPSSAQHADVRGQESTPPPPEMKALERLVGTWKVEQIAKVPNESRSTKLVVKRELVLGGRFVQEMGGFDDKGKPTFMGTYTYDSTRKTYRYWFFLSSGFYWEPTGTWDESSQTFTFTGRLGAGAIGTMTMTLRFSDEATFVLSMITRDAGGEISFHLEGKSVRQK